MGDQVLQATKRTGQSQPSAPRVRLTCEACCQRKVKCDKLSPCTSCQRLGLVCVPVERARLPRGRAQKTAERALGSDKELSDRVAKLEQLLQKFATERGSDSPQAPTVTDQRCNIVEQVSDAETKKADVGTWRNQVALSNLNLPHGPRRSTTYVGSSFWEDIMQQTQELRSILVDRIETDHQDIKDPSGFGFSRFNRRLDDLGPRSFELHASEFATSLVFMGRIAITVNGMGASIKIAAV